MKIYLYLIIIVSLAFMVTSCNDEVFVARPTDTPPPTEDPENPEPPENTDRLVLKSLTYLDDTLEVGQNEITTQSRTTYKNFAGSRGVSISYDAYNKCIVRITNSTYYVTPWADSGQPEIEVPGLNSEGIPGFYETMIPFSFGRTILPGEYKAGEIESFDLPNNCQVTATVYVTKKVVRAKADIVYCLIDFPDMSEKGWVEVVVEIPVDIRVEWGEVMPAEL